jgi:hypothetical protein
VGEEWSPLPGGGGAGAGATGEWGDAALPPLVEGELAGMPMEELTQRCGVCGDAALTQPCVLIRSS